jgi:hypothetical protein
VWFEYPGHPAVRFDAESQAGLVTDSRVTQWWFNEHQASTPKNDSVAINFGDASWTGCSYAWDMSLLFDAAIEWTGVEPPAPEYCMAKVGGCCNSYNISNFKNAVDGLEACETDTTTAIYEVVDNELNITVAPNPVTDELVITSNENLQQATVRLIDMNGKVIYSGVHSLNNEQIVLSLANENIGKEMYLLEIGSGNYLFKKKMQIHF